MQNEIDFGMEVEAFLDSSIGKFIIGRAEDEIDDSLEELKHVSPEDADKIRMLQNRIFRCESIQYWLAEAIQAGSNALRELTENPE